MSYPKTASKAKRDIAAKKKAKPRKNLLLLYCSNITHDKGKGGEKLSIGKNCILSPIFTKNDPIPCNLGFPTDGKMKSKCYTNVILDEGHPAPVYYRRKKK